MAQLEELRGGEFRIVDVGVDQVGDLLQEHLVGIADLLDLGGHHLLAAALFEILFVLDEQQDDPAVQVLEAEWLADECIGKLIGFELDALALLAREDDDRQEGRGHRTADLAAHLHPVHDGHHDVGDDQVDLVSGQEFEPLLAVFGADERIVVAERSGDEVADILVVLDQQKNGLAFVVPHL